MAHGIYRTCMSGDSLLADFRLDQFILLDTWPYGAILYEAGAQQLVRHGHWIAVLTALWRTIETLTKRWLLIERLNPKR